MREYIKTYITKIDARLNNNEELTKEEKQIFKDKITYFAHERLIHLLVTLFYVIYTLFFFFMGMVSLYFLIPFFIGIIFLLFYIPHYFFLENAVQYMYKLYDKIFKVK